MLKTFIAIIKLYTFDHFKFNEKKKKIIKIKKINKNI